MRGVAAQSRQAGDPVLGDAAGHDAGEVAEVRRDVEATPWKLTQRRSLTPMAAIFSSPPGGVLDPDADPAGTRLACDAELRQRRDDPGLQGGDEGAHVAAALAQVEHDIGHPLAGPVIGVLPAAAALEHREASRLQQVGGLGRDAGGVERRMLQQPDQLARPRRAAIASPARSMAATASG